MSTEAADRWNAPWTDAQVAALNAYQTSGAAHPYTCPHHGGAPRLIAFTVGWRCAACTYKQDWAHPIPTGRKPGEAVHKPFTDDGITYCGWDGHDGCGQLWPCDAVRAPESGWLAPLAAERLFEQRDTAIAERDAMRPVIEAAQAFVGQFERRATGFPRRDALAAAVDAYNATKEATE